MASKAGAAVATIALLMAVGNVSAAGLTGSGKGLQMLHKLQGRWQTHCKMNAGAGHYQRQVLHFSYTHLRQRNLYFSDSGCTREVHEQSLRYRYTLREPMDTVAGERAYALNLQAEEDNSGLVQLHSFNIVRYSDGELLLGRVQGEDQSQRLTSLDISSPYTRP